MSNETVIDGVTVSHEGGGYYELTHTSLTAPERVRGKEVAEARAKEIAAASAGAASDTDASIPPQPPLDKVVDDAAKDAEIAALKAQLAQSEERLASIRTVHTDGSAPQIPNQVPTAIPRQFTGPLDADTKEHLEKLGVKTTLILLEDNESIPPTGLFIGHNGRGYMITPGVPVEVPDFLLGVLDDAVTSTPVMDNRTQKVLGYRSRMKYSYRRL